MKWMLGTLLFVAGSLGGCCQPEVWAKVLFGTELKSRQVRALPESNVVIRKATTEPVEQVKEVVEQVIEEVVEPVMAAEDIIEEKALAIEEDVATMREVLGDGAKVVEVQLNRIEVNAAIIRAEVQVIRRAMDFLGVVVAALSTIEGNSHGTSMGQVPGKAIPATKPVVLEQEDWKDSLIWLLVVVIVFFGGVIIRLWMKLVRIERGDIPPRGKSSGRINGSSSGFAKKDKDRHLGPGERDGPGSDSS